MATRVIAQCSDPLAIDPFSDKCQYLELLPSTVANSNGKNIFGQGSKLKKLYDGIQSLQDGSKDTVIVNYTWTVLKYNKSYFQGYNNNGPIYFNNKSLDMQFSDVIQDCFKVFKMYEELFESLWPGLNINFNWKPIDYIKKEDSFMFYADFNIRFVKNVFSPTYAITSLGVIGSISFNDGKEWRKDGTDENGRSFARVLVHEAGHSLGIGHSSYTDTVTGLKDSYMLTSPPPISEDLYDQSYDGKLRINGSLLRSYTIKYGIYQLYSKKWF